MRGIRLLPGSCSASAALLADRGARMRALAHMRRAILVACSIALCLFAYRCNLELDRLDLVEAENRALNRNIGRLGEAGMAFGQLFAMLHFAMAIILVLCCLAVSYYGSATQQDTAVALITVSLLTSVPLSSSGTVSGGILHDIAAILVFMPVVCWLALGFLTAQLIPWSESWRHAAVLCCWMPCCCCSVTMFADVWAWINGQSF